jgi:transposase-like protein
LVEEYERSGMSGAAFAEHVGVKYTTLASWIQRKRNRAQSEQEAPGQNQPVQWVEAMVPASPSVEVRRTGLLLEFGGGARMEIADQKGAILAAEILRHLGDTRVC